MPQSIHNKILTKVKKLKKGSIIFPADFSDYGLNNTIHATLMRLEKEEILERLSKGIYLYPKKDPILGILRPSIDTIALAIAKRDKARIIPTGNLAMLKLGLSTQIPMKAVYLTDGNPRKIKINNGEIIFRKTSPKRLAIKGKISGLVIQALDEIGKNHVTHPMIEQINNLLTKEDPVLIKEDAKLAPSWIKTILHNYLNKAPI